MMGCVFYLCILSTFLSGVHASLTVHKDPMSWKAAGISCGQNNKVLLNSFDEDLIQQLTSCMNGTNLTFWTGGYTSNVTLRDWIAFRGCFHYNHQSANISKRGQFHTVSSCHQFCGTRMFGVTINSCLCLDDNIITQHSTIQTRNKCIQSGEEYIGVNGTIAIYKPVVISHPDSNSWCSAYKCIGTQSRHYEYFAMRCSSTAYYTCDTDNGYHSYKTVTWDEAMRACSEKGSYFTGPLPRRSCGSRPHIRYWSYVRRFREHNYVTRDTTWGSNIVECEIAQLNGGSITLKRTADCKTKHLPYICQSDKDNDNIYIESPSGRCNLQGNATKVSYQSQSSSPMQTIPLSTANSGPNERQTTTQFTSQGMDMTDYETRATHSGEEIVHTTNQFTHDSSTHSARNMNAYYKDSRVGLIGGVVAACIVIVVAVVVISIVCRKRSSKKKHKERQNASSSKERYHPWSDTKQSAEQGEINMNNISIVDLDLYDMSGEGEYDHLRSNNRRIKKEVDAMYDATAQVRAEEELYSSTRKGNNYDESSDFYDAMQRVNNECENIYDHSMTASNYSQTSAPLYTIAQYCSDPKEC